MHITRCMNSVTNREWRRDGCPLFVGHFTQYDQGLSFSGATSPAHKRLTETAVL